MKRTHVYGALWAMLAVLVISTGIAVSTGEQGPPHLYEHAGDHGYTISLILFWLPVLALAIWFGRHRARIDRHWKAFWATFAIIVGLWSTVDILLARTFFAFPNPSATLGINAPGYDPVTGWGFVVPIEEFAFYILGCAFLVLMYIWASELWFPEHTMHEAHYEEAVLHTKISDFFHWQTIVGGVATVALAWAVKAWDPMGMAEGGFPWYVTFMVLIVIVPTSMFFRVVLRFVNVRALVFTLQSLLLVALLWEATLALPYGWWDYNPDQMMGVFIKPWSNLPIEEPMLWASATWSNIAIYEVFKVLFHRKAAATDQT